MKILAVTGTRADYGIWKPVFDAIIASETLDLGLIVTGMHLRKEFGQTIDLIRSDGFAIAATVDTLPKTDARAATARYVAETITGIADVLEKEKPDLLMLLGDRGEMLAGAIAASEIGIPLLHLHGGESSGTIDDFFRHAITHLSDIHCTSAPAHTARVKAMKPGARVFTVGAPAIDVIRTFTPVSKEKLMEHAGFDPALPTVLFVQHPDTLSELSPKEQIERSITALKYFDGNLLILGANADAGGRLFNKKLQAFAKKRAHTAFMITLPHEEFLSWLACADLLMGNSSSGIIEAASFHLPVLNIGDRQRGRLRSGNALDVAQDAKKITTALRKLLTDKKLRAKLAKAKNAYGDGHAAGRIVKILEKQSMGTDFSRARLSFESPRLQLKIMGQEHATEDYAGWLNDPEVNRYLGTKSATVDELRSYIAAKHEQPDCLFFGIFRKSDGKHIGTVKLEPIERQKRKATIAVMIGDKNSWGQGFAGEAMQLLIDWCFEELGMEEMNLGVIAKNTAAIRSYEKLGFKETKRDPGYVRYGDELHDQVWMALWKKV